MFKETRECLNPHKTSSAVAPVHPRGFALANNSPEAVARMQPPAQAETSGLQSASHVTPPESSCEEGKSRRRINQVGQDYYCNYIIILVYHHHHRY